jgi:hypothetical protein
VLGDDAVAAAGTALSVNEKHYDYSHMVSMWF